MGQEPLHDTPEFRALQAALEEQWPQRQKALRESGVFLNDEDDDGNDDDGNDDDGADDGGSDDDAGAGAKTYDESYVKKLREENAKHRREKQDLAARLKTHEDADKTELERVQEARQTAEQRAAAAESASLRLEVALDKAPEGMSVQQVRKLAKRLTGADREELEADAEELFADFAPEGNEDGQEPPRRPKENLRSGTGHGSSDDDEELDPDALAELVPRRYKL